MRCEKSKYQTHFYRDPDHDYDGQCPNRRIIRADIVEETTGATLMSVRLPESWRRDIANLAKSYSKAEDTERRRARAQAKSARGKELYLESLMSKEKKDHDTTEAQAELDSLRLVPQSNLE